MLSLTERPVEGLEAEAAGEHVQEAELRRDRARVPAEEPADKPAAAGQSEAR